MPRDTVISQPPKGCYRPKPSDYWHSPASLYGPPLPPSFCSSGVPSFSGKRGSLSQWRPLPQSHWSGKEGNHIAFQGFLLMDSSGPSESSIFLDSVEDSWGVVWASHKVVNPAQHSCLPEPLAFLLYLKPGKLWHLKLIKHRVPWCPSFHQSNRQSKLHPAALTSESLTSAPTQWIGPELVLYSALLGCTATYVPQVSACIYSKVLQMLSVHRLFPPRS